MTQGYCVPKITRHTEKQIDEEYSLQFAGLGQPLLLIQPT